MGAGSVVSCAVLITLIGCASDAPESSEAETGADTAAAAVPSSVAGTATEDGAAGLTPGSPRPGPRLLTPDGWAELRIGMSRAELTAAAGADANPGAVGGPDPERCDEFRPADAPEGVLVMVEDDVLTRISVSRNRDIATPAGFRVGDSGSAVTDEYGARAAIEPHRYWATPARYITVWSESPNGGRRRGVRYEVDADDAIVHIRAGGESITYVEGCI